MLMEDRRDGSGGRPWKEREGRQGGASEGAMEIGGIRIRLNTTWCLTNRCSVVHGGTLGFGEGSRGDVRVATAGVSGVHGCGNGGRRHVYVYGEDGDESIN